MAPLRSVVVLSLLVPALLAGCLGGDGGGPKEPGDDPDVPDDPIVTARTGAVTGYVLDVAFAPIIGATVTVTETGANVTSDESGAYTINDLEPKSYTLVANHSAYRPKAKPIVIVAGEVSREQFLLEQLPQVEPRMALLEPFQGYIECATSSTGRCVPTGQNGNHRPSGTFVIEPGLTAVLYEMTWSNQQGVGLNDDGSRTGSGGGMRLQVSWSGNNGGGGNPEASGYNGETLRVYLVREQTAEGMRIFCREGCQAGDLDRASSDWPDKAGLTMSFVGGPNSPNVVMQRPFTVHMTAWYNSLKEEGYSAVPDA